MLISCFLSCNQPTANSRFPVSEHRAGQKRVFSNSGGGAQKSIFCWLFRWLSPDFALPFSGRRLETNGFQNGSKGRTRTVDPIQNTSKIRYFIGKSREIRFNGPLL